MCIRDRFDTVQVEVALPSELFSKYSLCICSNPKRMKMEYKDLESLTVQPKSKLPRGLSMLTECDDISSEFLRACGPDVLKALDSLKETIDFIHISDTCSTDPRHEYMLRCVFRCPSQKMFEENPDIVLNQVRLTVSLIDVVAQVSAWCAKHGEVMTKINSTRTERSTGGSAQERTQERLQKRRDEKLVAEKAKKAKMTDAQLAKYEEKEYKKAMKKKNKVGGGKMKMMKI
eukprot:TRINITY_DN2119_c0_g1_i2.p1 TRINITY_DN2119_c0_g1~~TRINITY_DN2119_c0_g1_i2.p1  ORF type:complete len:231 (+),score=74.01 TRINITY_DN2119_c0_g1_i2:73-765(+)